MESLTILFKKILMQKISILGDGGWGTTLSRHLCLKGFPVSLWSPFPEYAKHLQKTRENTKFLAGVKIPHEIDITSDLEAAINGKDIIIIAIPSQYIRSVLSKISKKCDKKALYVSVSKGIEEKSLMRISEIVKTVIGDVNFSVLSGPSIAIEVVKGIPTVVVAASGKIENAKIVQDIFMAERFRVYTTTDVAGVELGGSVKNIIAIAAGINDGLGLGSNSKSALMIRGIVEMARLGAKFGADENTFKGLSGMGDLITTCISKNSRNRWFGEEIGKGKKISEILKTTEMVVEGFATTRSVYELSNKLGVDMPITKQVYSILYEKKNPKDAVFELMSRPPKTESQKN